MIRKSREIRVETLLLVAASLAAGVGIMTVADSVSSLSLLIFLVLWMIGLAAYLRARDGLPSWLANGFALLAVAVTFLVTPGSDAIAARLGLIVILLGVKFSRTKTPRDYLQIFLLVIFLLAGEACLFLDVAFLFPLLALLLVLGIGAVLLSYFSEDPSLRISFGIAGTVCLWTALMTLVVLPLVAALFVLLPRSGYPMLDFRGRRAAGVTGFSNKIALGVVANIQDSNAVALRMETGQGRIAESQLYWRGIVFDNFDGKNWIATPARNREDAGRLRLNGTPVSYTVYLEPSHGNLLVTLDKPLSVSLRRAVRRPDLTYFSFTPANRPLRYGALSVPTEVISTPAVPEQVYRQLPPGLERIKKQTASLVPAHAEAATAIKTLMSFLKGGNFQYAQSSLPPSDKPLEEFIFTSRRGNCEYFASALAVMLRMAGIPARIVGGYRGGYFQEGGGYYVVYEKNAHVWVEAYVPETGWVRLDPTPAQGAAFTSAAGRGLRFWSIVKFDLLQYYFMILVLNFDAQTQVRLLSLLGSTLGRLPDLLLQGGKYPAVLVAIFIMLGLSPYLYGRLQRWGGSYEERLLRTFLARMEKMGYRKAPDQGLEEFVKSFDKEETYRAAAEFVTRYEESFYRDRPLSRGEAAFLEKMIGRIGQG